ncbi:stage III sporulation protein AA [Paenibacillus sp. MBLB4367]|uniref:stage III sporulation protein AA n=1 Tax=Paenibacillus sp. MBLB4367 TaxID=3384767 RepID=UPI003907F718
MLESVWAVMPPVLLRMLRHMPEQVQRELEEIRIRENRPLEIVSRGRYAFLTEQSLLTQDAARGYRPDREVCATLLDLLTNHSLYTFEEELRRGYITIAGGHRVGLAGKTVLEHGAVKLIRDITGFNIRVAREIRGCGLNVLQHLADDTGFGISVHHTLVVSPPQHGKTTLIRDLARLLSAGEWPNRTAGGLKVGIVDERSELAACIRGVPRFDVGPRTDVLDGCPKAEGMMMMIRSMSPDVLIVDEIGRPEDAASVREALHAGIRVIASAHGFDYGDVRKRPVLRELLADGLFARVVCLAKKEGVPAIAAIYDGEGHTIAGSAAPRLAREVKGACSN